METVISLIPNDEHLAMARQELEIAGVAKNKILVLNQPTDVWQQLEGRQKVRTLAKKAGIGALVGLVVGALYGIPAGLFNCLMGACPVETSLGFLLLISLYWVVAGGFLGALIGFDRLEQELMFYVNGVRRGESLIMVETPDEQEQEVMDILHKDSGTIIHAVHNDITEVKPAT